MIPPPTVEPTPQTPLHYICYRAPSTPTIDGRLDKPFWQDIPWSEPFVDIEGDAKPKPAFKTRMKMAWDDQYLYVGAELEEPHVWGTLTQRDSIVFHDNDFEVFLNPTGDNHRYYEVEINPLNTIFDLFLPKPYRDGGPADHGWDVKGLISAVHVDGTLNAPHDIDTGWTVELALPWSAFDRHDTIKSPPSDGDQWRINFSRVEWKHQVANGCYSKVPNTPENNWVWSPQGIIDMHRPEQWGYVQFSSIVAGKGQAKYIPDSSMNARSILHAVYYAQGQFKASNNRWAASIAELESSRGKPFVTDPLAQGTLTLSSTPDDWSATVTPAKGAATSHAWSIRQDSLVTRSPERR